MDFASVPGELLVAGVVVAAALLVFVLARFGRQILLFLLALGGLVVMGLIALAMVQQSAATKEAARAAEVASVGQTIASATNSFLVGVLVTLIVGALGIGGYFWMRWRMAERRASRSTPGAPAIQPRHPARRRLPPPPWWADWERWQGIPPTVYYVDEREQEVDVPVDPTTWGWE